MVSKTADGRIYSGLSWPEIQEFVGVWGVHIHHWLCIILFSTVVATSMLGLYALYLFMGSSVIFLG